MGDQPAKTPLIELARNVPTDFRGEWETQWFEDGTPCGHAMAPVGQYLHDLADEIERLTDKLERIEQWCKAYPHTVFIEPTKEQWAAADKALNRSDCPSLSAISGSNMRHVVEGIKALSDTEDK